MTAPRTPAVQLTRRRLGMIHIMFFTLTAVAPLSVLAGSIVPTFALSGVTAYPLALVVIAVPLALFVFGYAAMSRYVANAGAFYSYLAHGLGPTMAVAGAFVALVAYNGLQIAIYGVWGPVVADYVKQQTGVDLPWWVYALAALVIVGMLGVLRIDLNAKLLAVVLAAEVIIVVVFFDVGAFTHPAEGAALAAAWSPSSLLVPGAGAVIALGVSAFTGFEQGAIYGEEVRNPRVTVARATFATLAIAVVLFAVSSWAMLVTVGPSAIQKAATEQGPGLVFSTLDQHWGGAISTIATVLFFTGIFASLVSFHNGIARYFFALGRENVLPGWLGRVGVRSGGPSAGSLLQTGLAVVLILVFVIAGADPLLQMYAWLAALSAVAILVLMAGTSVAVIGFFRKRPSRESAWHRVVAPALATVGLLVLLFVVVGNFDALGIDPASPLRWGLPALVLVAVLAGVARAQRLRAVQPELYAAIGTTGMSIDEDDEPELGHQSRHSQLY
jgi:amino acid transporter